VSDTATRVLLATPAAVIRDICCQGSHAGRSAEEWTAATHLVFSYRGLYVRHLGRDDAVADANQVLFFNAGDVYRVSHPVAGGDASVDVVVAEPLLHELAPPGLVHDGPVLRFRQHRLRIDPRVQAMIALLRHRLIERAADTLEAETLVLALVRRALGTRTAHAPGATAGRRRLVDRIKLVVGSDPTRRWTLSQIAAEVGRSPVYLTQIFQQVEGVPLYRYHLRLRLARALDLLPEYDDLTALGLDLGFSSHSHFTTAFRQAYGRSPSSFRQAALGR